MTSCLGSILFLSTLRYQGEVDPVALSVFVIVVSPLLSPCIYCPSLEISVSMTTEELAGS